MPGMPWTSGRPCLATKRKGGGVVLLNTRSRGSFPCLKWETRFPAKVTGTPVFGLRAWRGGRLDGKLSNLAINGSKRSRALLPQSGSQTLS